MKETIKKLIEDLNEIENINLRMTPRWSGDGLTTVFTVNDTQFKVLIRISNGGSDRTIYILGTTGWTHYLSTTEIGFKASDELKRTSYVSDENDKCAYSAEATYALVNEVAKING